MKLITLKIEENYYALFLQFLETLPYVEIIKPIPTPNYDFSDLVGKLQWKGDGLKEQRRLRNEW